MKIAVLIARILLGLIFVFFGLNIFFHFLPTPPSAQRHFWRIFARPIRVALHSFVGAVQVLGGALLLIGRYIALGLVRWYR